ncbi:MAG TPA: hypothetical protein VIX37_03360 [Candidatus Sulfotelmatobacter sp.]
MSRVRDARLALKPEAVVPVKVACACGNGIVAGTRLAFDEENGFSYLLRMWR